MSDSVLRSTTRQALAPTPDNDLPIQVTGRVRWGRIAFSALAWLLAGCVALQVFFAGMGVFTGPSWWNTHTTFVHLFEYVPLLMLIAAFVGRLPARAKWLSLAAFLLIGLQYAFIEIDLPGLAALHPVNALLLFWLAIALARSRPSSS